MKRTFWTGVGYTLGLGTSVVVQRRVKRTIDRYAPEQLRADIGDKGRAAASRARDTAIDLRDAAREGVAAMRQERDQLLSEFAPDVDAAPGHSPSHTEPAAGRFRPRHTAGR